MASPSLLEPSCRLRLPLRSVEKNVSGMRKMYGITDQRTSGFDVLTTRPVFVLVRAFGFSSETAGAAFGLVVFFDAVFGAAAFFAAGFLAVAVFFGAALVVVFFGAAVFFAAVVFLGAAAVSFFSVFGFAVLVAAAGFLSADGLASFTGPDAPFGWANTPLSTPVLRALLMWAVKALSVVLPRLLLALMYFLMAWRLWREDQSADAGSRLARRIAGAAFHTHLQRDATTV